MLCYLRASCHACQLTDILRMMHTENRVCFYDNSHVQAAYASFLWDTEEDEDDSNEPQCLPPHPHQGAMATAGAWVWWIGEVRW